jgi:ankyrin repeat protein
MTLTNQAPNMFCFIFLSLTASVFFGCAHPNVALLDCARDSDLSGVMRQIDRGADVNYQDPVTGATALHLTVYMGFNRESKYLIQHRANVNIQDIDAWTPLHVAAGKGRLEAARMLIQAGAAVDVRENQGRTPLHFAAQQNQAEIAMLLIGSGANLQAKDAKGSTPLQLAMRAGNREMAQQLRKHGAR